MIGKMAQVARGLTRDTQPREPWRATVAVVRSDGMLEVAPLDSDAGTQPLAILEGGAYDVGDEVWVFPAGSGWVVAGKNKRAAGAHKLANVGSPVRNRKSTTAAITTSTTNTVTWVDAIESNPIVLGPGTWTVTVEGGANFAHSGGEVVDRRAILGASLGGSAGATMLTTREHYAIDAVFAGIVGNQTLTGKIQYKGGAGTSGTSSCRAPYIVMYAERTA